jgi:hypothetical protein
MPPISIKRVVIATIIIVLLAKLDRVIAFFNSIYEAFYNAFEPLRNSPPLGKYIAALMFLLLLYITIFKLLQRRK